MRRTRQTARRVTFRLINFISYVDFYYELWPYLSNKDIRTLASVSARCRIFCIEISKLSLIILIERYFKLRRGFKLELGLEMRIELGLEVESGLQIEFRLELDIGV